LAAARKPRWTLTDDDIVDEIAVRRAADGEPVRLTRTERETAARRIIAMGGGTSKMAKRLHMSGHTAKTWYERLIADHRQA
jgi:DNA invertase Pin-like site-specific DNA recombinase